MPSDRNSHLSKVLGTSLFDKVTNCRVLVVGAGGIGCELIKNLVMSGFRKIEVIDLDTIDVSNLNRQFLFRKKHVGQSKALIAREMALSFNPNENIELVSHHGNVKDDKFGLSYFQTFDLVMNALDNVSARRHVNRLCLAANIPLVESGTQGYIGQVTLHKKNESECFDCTPHPTPKTYAVCTLRDTPDKPVHCIHWAKLIYAVLFGPHDDENVMIDLKVKYNPADETKEEYAKRLFSQYFYAKVMKALEVKERWKKKKAPIPLELDKLQKEISETDESESLDLQRVPTIAESTQKFIDTIIKILEDKRVGELIFDKDDDLAMDFVACASNLRMAVFSISMQSQFEIKGIAGNIVHAIATTNAIAAGLVVIEALKVLDDRSKDCKTTWITQNPRNLLQPQTLEPPNKKCYVCGTASIAVTLNVDTFTIGDLVKFSNTELGTNAPSFNWSTGSVDDEDYKENESLLTKNLQEFKINNGCLVEVGDFLQDFTCRLIVNHSENIDEKEYPKGYIYGKNVSDTKDSEDAIVTVTTTTTTDTVTTAPKESKDATSTTTTTTTKEKEVVTVTQENKDIAIVSSKRKNPENSEIQSKNGVHKVQKVK